MRRTSHCVGLLALLFAAQVAAQAYPVRPVHLIVPSVAGGATDVLARVVAEGLGTRLGQPLVVENRPGAGTVLATSQVAKLGGDGYTLLFGTLAHAINATLNRKLSYDPLADFEFIGKIGQLTFAVTVSPSLGAEDLAGLVGMLRANPGKTQYGSAGVGSPMHVGGELLKQLTRTDAIHIPYKGEAAALADLLGGRITFMLCSVPTCAGRFDEGSLRALAVSSPARSPRLPKVPTGAEAGVAGLETYSWFMIIAPKGTPRTVVDRVSEAINAMLQDAAFKTRIAATGAELDTRSSPEATRAFVQSEIDKWRPIVRASGAVVD